MAPSAVKPQNNACLQTTMSWTSFIRLTNETGPNGEQVAVGYDAMARSSSTTSPHGVRTGTHSLTSNFFLFEGSPSERGWISTSRSLPLRFEDGDVGQVAVVLFVVEAEADDEAVGDFEAAEVDGEGNDAAGGAVEQGAEGDGVGAAAGEGLQQIAGREARVDDIFDQDDVFAFDGIVEILRDANNAGGAGVVREARDGEEIHFHRDGDFAHESGEEEDGAFEDSDEFEVAVFVLFGDFGGDGANALVDLIFREQDALDRWERLAHELTGCSERPYFTTRSWMSF